MYFVPEEFNYPLHRLPHILILSFTILPQKPSTIHFNLVNVIKYYTLSDRNTDFHFNLVNVLENMHPQ